MPQMANYGVPIANSLNENDRDMPRVDWACMDWIEKDVVLSA